MPIKKSGFVAFLQRLWCGARKWAYKYVGSMFMEDKKNGELAMSIGRVMLMILFFAMIWSWRRVLLADVAGPVDAVLPDGMLACFYALLGYVLGGKGVKAIRTYRRGWITQEIELGAARTTAGDDQMRQPPSGGVGDQPAPEGP